MGKYKHGHYVLLAKRGIYIFNTKLKKGRILLHTGEAKEITYKTHPKTVRSIIFKGEHCVNPYNLKENLNG